MRRLSHELGVGLVVGVIAVFALDLAWWIGLALGFALMSFARFAPTVDREKRRVKRIERQSAELAREIEAVVEVMEGAATQLSKSLSARRAVGPVDH